MTVAITEDEIEKALNSIRDLKAPCIDGYGAYFFKKAWNIVKYDVVKAVQDFFVNGCDARSIEIMMNTFDKFSKSTGPKVNPAKSCIYFGGVDHHMKENIKHILKFKDGSLPFRYQGLHEVG
ncbi:hypothetical protein KIW84_024307 [Lathyrus oleraceus]|uniref:RNA-directed DNA polymerase, eukaryota, reverse transcriptase zinc-binding domain protein n=1 Tax=Pisum sativum TaxID=3888 RepID=A0A9D5BC71_PEA|nr:hypothetical protein KIW84_024307 [Pisum sativum]